MKNGEIINILNKLGDVIDVPFNVKTSFKLISNKRKMLEANKDYTDTLKEITEKYNLTINDKGIDTNILEGDKKIEFFKELNELLELETKIDIDKIEISDLGDIDISPAQLETLMFMID